MRIITYKRAWLLCCVIIATAQHVAAQHAHFIYSGTITYEKRVNMHACINQRLLYQTGDGYAKTMLETYKGSQPQFKTYTYTLRFDRQHSLYAPTAKPIANNWAFVEGDPAIDHQLTAYADLGKRLRVSGKNLGGQWYSIADSLRSIRWKLTDEHREIAGFDCRRANGLVMDSVYVVAYFTEQIHVPSGPESFQGLPGMILGLALPDQHITWFATTIVESPVNGSSLQAPANAKTITKPAFEQLIVQEYKSEGGYLNVIKSMLLL